MQKTLRNTGKRRLKNIFLLPGFVLLALVIFAGLELLGVTRVFHKNNSPVTHIIGKPDTAGGGTQNSQKGEAAPATSSNSSSTPQPGDNKSNTDGTTTVLLAPSGNFVSNHHPNLGGSPAPDTMTSVCDTTPGATCTITFIKDGITKTLSAQSTDRSGSAFWNNWSLAVIGLTAGSWKVQAVAMLDGQTKTTTDPMSLEVSP